MMSIAGRPPRKTSIVATWLYGAVIALVIAYVCSYVLTRQGLGVVGARGRRAEGRAVFARSAINLYAIQHVTLVGGGEVSDALGNREKVSAHITLPLTVWAIVPALSLGIGGYMAARRRSLLDRFAMTTAAVASGVIYAAVLVAAACFVSGRFETFLMPEIGGVSPNPPEILFRPSLASTAAYCTAFGIVFGYLGGLIAVRSAIAERYRAPWWACCKAVVATAVVVQLVLACGVLVLSARRARPEGEEQPRIAEMLPTAAGLGYALIHGADLLGSVESRIGSEEAVQRAFYVRVNAYTGTTQDSEHKPASAGVFGACLAVGAIAAFICGMLAVRWGSRDGPMRTGLRVALLNTLYVAAMIGLCAIELWQSNGISASTILVRGLFTPALVVSFVTVALVSMIGASVVGRRYRRTSSPPGQVGS